jgi:hypothetical protein
MVLDALTVVRLTTDRYQDKGVPCGAVGVILEIYEDEAYEVEFSREDGTTISWFAVMQDEVEALTEPFKKPCAELLQVPRGNHQPAEES